MLLSLVSKCREPFDRLKKNRAKHFSIHDTWTYDYNDIFSIFVLYTAHGIFITKRIFIQRVYLL